MKKIIIAFVLLGFCESGFTAQPEPVIVKMIYLEDSEGWAYAAEPGL